MTLDTKGLRGLLAPGKEHPWQDHDGGGRPNRSWDHVEVQLRDGERIVTDSAFIPWVWDGEVLHRNVMRWRPVKRMPTDKELAAYIPALLNGYDTLKERVAALEAGLRAVLPFTQAELDAESSRVRLGAHRNPIAKAVGKARALLHADGGEG